MREKTPWILSALLAIALVVATAFAIWPAVGDAPWEKTTACAVYTPSPAPSQEEAEKVACLQGGGEWVYTTAYRDANTGVWENRQGACGPKGAPCWACFHPLLR
jgi:hypothetical protein